MYEEKGESAKAAAEYRKFLEYWKDADASHPELADAKKRLKKGTFPEVPPFRRPRGDPRGHPAPPKGWYLGERPHIFF